MLDMFVMFCRTLLRGDGLVVFEKEMKLGFDGRFSITLNVRIYGFL